MFPFVEIEYDVHEVPNEDRIELRLTSDRDSCRRRRRAMLVWTAAGVTVVIVVVAFLGGQCDEMLRDLNRVKRSRFYDLLVDML